MAVQDGNNTYANLSPSPLKEDQIKNEPLEAVLGLYRSIEREYTKALEGTGVSFARWDNTRKKRQELLDQLSNRGASIRNKGASVVLGGVSKACIACTGACVSRSYALSNNCHRDCFFCFNPNQKEFAYYCEHFFPWKKQLDELAATPEKPSCVALTGGEPLLYPDETIAFFEYAHRLFPQSHLRIYTSGDLLDKKLLHRLQQAGLDEIRFSVKQSDSDELRENVLQRMSWAKELIPTVMVEMPVIPGTEDFMHELLRRLDTIGIDGINLLEFAYPMWNWPVYESLGLTLRNPVANVLYDYEYAGSLPIQDSEELCLSLMIWAHDEGLHLGMHYCSLENKHRAQMRNLNEKYANIDSRYAFDYGDFFLKTAMVFGPDRELVRNKLIQCGCKDFIEDEPTNSTSFHPRWIPIASKVKRNDLETVQVGVSYNVAVTSGRNKTALRELKVGLIDTEPAIELDGFSSIDKEMDQYRLL